MSRLSVKVMPNAKQTRFVEWMDGGVLRIRLAAPPVDGKANKVLIDFLAKSFGLRKSQIKIVKGEKSREKTIDVSGIEDDELLQMVNLLISS
ncbi:MAG: DUF167 domain-containing protein [Verrucomicrobiales bacterium]|nr:DUF167 domain-containing protein [Verrucomicrobiales bacterium]